MCSCILYHFNNPAFVVLLITNIEWEFKINFLNKIKNFKFDVTVVFHFEFLTSYKCKCALQTDFDFIKFLIHSHPPVLKIDGDCLL